MSNAHSCLFAASLLAPFAGLAQNTPPADDRGLEEVLVTATKQAQAVAAQDVGLAITAFSGEQLEKGFARDLQSLTVGMPNVQLDSVGSQKSTANFTIRGLGTNSSIPSIEPTVGVFYDGIYLGINAGIIYDFLDIEGIEVLRGPQGLLFGRNVTGGAIVINTRKPSQTFEGAMKLSVTDRMNKTISASVSGPLVDGVLAARLAAMYNDDDGWFKNEFNGKDFGVSDTWVVRPSITWTPIDIAEVTLRFEHGEYNGQGPASQNRSPALAAFEGRHDRHSHSININQEGFGLAQWDMAIAEANVEVGPGTLTNIFGWRTYEDDTLADIDGRPTTAFDVRFITDQEQFSNELRYAANFARVKLTTGLYWFTQEINYFETRVINTSPTAATASQAVGHLGGVQESTTKGVFASADVNLSDKLILNLGARYTDEQKDAIVAVLGLNAADPCPGLGLTGKPDASKCTFAFPGPGDRGSVGWSDVTPKLGLQYLINDDAQIYGFFTEGFRGGGYNMRNSVVGVPPGPFDPEEQKSYELGAKADWFDGRLRTNLALFYNEIRNMQREVNITSASGIISQFIRNTADATIQGVELEMLASITPDLLITANVGYVDGAYDPGSIRFDISGDNLIDEVDEHLDIPRLSPLTWSIGANWETSLGQLGSLRSRVNFSHRDRAAFTDSNIGTLNTVDMLDASLTLMMLEERATVGIFGRNLTNRAFEGMDLQLPAIVAFSGANGTLGTYSPLKEGRVYGVELTYKF